MKLAGTAEGKRGTEPWPTRRPGESFVHASNQPHAMRTLDEPLLAICASTGDLGQWTKWVADVDEVAAPKPWNERPYHVVAPAGFARDTGRSSMGR